MKHHTARLELGNPATRESSLRGEMIWEWSKYLSGASLAAGLLREA